MLMLAFPGETRTNVARGGALAPVLVEDAVHEGDVVVVPGAPGARALGSRGVDGPQVEELVGREVHAVGLLVADAREDLGRGGGDGVLAFGELVVGAVGCEEQVGVVAGLPGAPGARASASSGVEKGEVAELVDPEVPAVGLLGCLGPAWGFRRASSKRLL